MLGVLPFVEDPDHSWSAAPALPQHLPPWPTAHMKFHVNISNVATLFKILFLAKFLKLDCFFVVEIVQFG